MAKKPVLLCIMDGFGWVPEQTFGNAIAAAKRPNLDRLFETYPYTTIQASGMAVGLPEGQMGNSEVGHTNMGAGRIVYQQLTLITKSIMDGTMKENDVLVRNMRAAIDAGKAVHLMGLLGTGGVHSHIDHLFGLLDLAKHLGAKKIYVHCIMDGRDTDPHSGKGFIADLQKKMGMAVILVTHDLGVIADMCDNIIVMYGGHICERGTTDEIFYNSRHEYTKGLLRSIPNVNNMKQKLIPIAGTPINILNLPAGCAFCTRCDEAMKICLEQQPEEMVINDDHYASCWMNVKKELEKGGAQA